ncbi:MAG: TolC family protein [Halanaerobiales bacterium]
MKKLLISIWIIFSLSIILSGNVLGEKIISPEKAVSLALEENLDLKIAELELESARYNYRKNRAINLTGKSRTQQLKAEYELAEAENTYHNTNSDIVNEIISKYYDLYLAEKMITIKEKSRKLEEILLEDIKKLVETGEKGELELLQQKNTYNTEGYNLKEVRHNYRQFLREFKNLTGINSSIEIELKKAVKPEILEIEREKVREKVLDNNLQLNLHKKNLKLVEAQKKKNLVRSIPELSKKIMENDYLIEQIKKEVIREDLEKEVENLYFEFQQSIKKIELERENLNESRASYNIAEQQFESGLNTRRDLLQVELEKLEAEYEYISAIGNYYINEKRLKQLITPEAGVLSK